MRFQKILVAGMTVFVFFLGCSNQKFEVQEQSQSFQQIQAYNNKVDLLMVMDVSSSMTQYKQKFAAQIPAFLEKLDKSEMDYRIGVTTTDLQPGGTGGVLLGTPKVLEKGNPNLLDMLQKRINFRVPGSSDELGLESMRRTLQTEGSLLLRKDALLVIIFMTNEDDYSFDKNGYIDPSRYIDFLEQLKPAFSTGVRSWVAHLIGVTSPSEMRQCQAVEMSVRYFSLVQRSQGQMVPVCSGSMLVALENIRVQILQFLTDYYLSRKPRPETIRVLVNGKVLVRNPENGWDYDETLNRIRFFGSGIPAIYDAVSVDFTPLDAGS